MSFTVSIDLLLPNEIILLFKIAKVEIAPYMLCIVWS